LRTLSEVSSSEDFASTHLGLFKEVSLAANREDEDGIELVNKQLEIFDNR
jgi:hypothetical protein